MRIGIIVATDREREPFFKVFGEPTHLYSNTHGYEVAMWQISHITKLFLIKSSYGEIAAASATQYIIDHYEVDKIINYGVVGALTKDHHVGDIGIVTAVVHYGFDLSVSGECAVGEYPGSGLYLKPNKKAFRLDGLKELNLKEFICASADKFVGAGRPKKQLNRRYDADICDMESAGILITCNRNDIPVIILKAISDDVNGGAEDFEKNVYDASRLAVEAVKMLIM